MAASGLTLLALHSPERVGNGVFGGLALLTSVAVVVGARVHRSPAMPAWLLLAVGQLAFALGDIGSSVYVHRLGVVPFPSAADAAYLAGYPLLLLGVAGLSRSRWAGRDTTTVIDTVIVTAVGATAVWVFVAGPHAAGTDAAVFDRVVSTAYCVGDIALLAIVARLLLSPGRRPPSLWLLGVALLLLLVADVVYGVQLIETGGYGHGATRYVTDGFWLLSYGFLGLAALHPSMRRLTAPAQPAGRPTYARIIVLGGALMTLPAMTMLHLGSDGLRSVGSILVATVAIIVLIVARMTMVVRLAERRADRLCAKEAALRRALRERDALTEELSHQAFHDSLTGLGNRARFLYRLHEALDAGAGPDAELAVLFCDLDGFKEVNDTLGHGAGDELLGIVAARVQACVRAGDTVARFGGDEFAVLLPGVQGPQAVNIAGRIAAAVGEPLILDCGPVQVGISVGIALSRNGHPGEQELLRRADVAMYVAKSSAIRRVVTYEEAGQDPSVRLVSASELANALPGGELRVHYQPIIDLENGRVEGLEALMRWAHPEHGLLGPGAFLGMAQALGFLASMDLHVLESAIAQLGRWRDESPDRAPFVSVNLSAAALLDNRLLPLVRAALAAGGLDARALVVEITEEILAADPGDVVSRVRALRALGVRVALDDFGTGYSSLSRLMNLPVDVLKIDRSFAQALPRVPGERNLASYVMELGQICDLVTIVEGVEERGQADSLRAHGCNLVQGYIFSEPLPADHIAALLAVPLPAPTAA